MPGFLVIARSELVAAEPRLDEEQVEADAGARMMRNITVATAEPMFGSPSCSVAEGSEQEGIEQIVVEQFGPPSAR